MAKRGREDIMAVVLMCSDGASLEKSSGGCYLVLRNKNEEKKGEATDFFVCVYCVF